MLCSGTVEIRSDSFTKTSIGGNVNNTQLGYINTNTNELELVDTFVEFPKMRAIPRIEGGSIYLWWLFDTMRRDPHGGGADAICH